MRRFNKKSLFWKIIVVVAIIILLKFSIQIFALATFRVPSDSMYPAIESKQRVFVNKAAYGARLFNPCKTIYHGNIFRLTGYNDPLRNDIIVFNDPYVNGCDSISFNVLRYLVKRIIALPGDSIEIRDCVYHIIGSDDVLGNLSSQNYLYTICRDSILQRVHGIQMNSYPNTPSNLWTIQNFGPLYVPQKGDTIYLNEDNSALYGNLVKWEVNSDYIPPMHVMEQNYYFVAGDNCVISLDSRHWGLIPEDFIVGRVDYISDDIWSNR